MSRVEKGSARRHIAAGSQLSARQHEAKHHSRRSTAGSRLAASRRGDSRRSCMGSFCYLWFQWDCLIPRYLLEVPCASIVIYIGVPFVFPTCSSLTELHVLTASLKNTDVRSTAQSTCTEPHGRTIGAPFPFPLVGNGRDSGW